MNHAQSKLPEQIPRTQPYAPPYNAPIPSGASNGSGRECTASHPNTNYIGRKLKPKRTLPLKWPVENMLEILDEKLFAAQEAQIFEDGFQPKRYIWSDHDTPSASPVPDAFHTLNTPSHWRVQSESWGRDGR